MPLTVGMLFPWRFSCSWLCSEMQSKSLWEGGGKGQHAAPSTGGSRKQCQVSKYIRTASYLALWEGVGWCSCRIRSWDPAGEGFVSQQLLARCGPVQVSWPKQPRLRRTDLKSESEPQPALFTNQAGHSIAECVGLETDVKVPHLQLVDGLKVSQSRSLE